MALDFQKQHSHSLVAVKRINAKQVFTDQSLENGLVRVPVAFHCLPDLRPASQEALEEAMAGWPPSGGPSSQFDPVLGPFSRREAGSSPWAQSLDFLRDIEGAAIGSTPLSISWLNTWLKTHDHEGRSSDTLFVGHDKSGSKTDRLVWRSRRILNCLSHVLPTICDFDPDLRRAFWSQLIQDIAKIGAPTDTLWENLKEGFHPLSARAIWLRSIAIAGVEAAFPGFIRTELVDKAIEQINASIQGDGLMAGGSIISTLAGGADLCMLSRLTAIEAPLERTRRALACLRRCDGGLITFGSGSSNHDHLLSAVLGSGDTKPANNLLTSGIGRMSSHTTVVWMRTAQLGRTWGASVEIEVGGCSLLTCFNQKPTAMTFPQAPQVSQARCRRRDEPDFVILEATATLAMSGKEFACVRQVRISTDGARILGEDVLRPVGDTTAGRDQGWGVHELRFSVSQTCRCYLSKDRLSVLIVTSQQHAWRFRIAGLDIAIEISSELTSGNGEASRQSVIVCRWHDAEHKSNFSTAWQLVLEGLE